MEAEPLWLEIVDGAVTVEDAHAVAAAYGVPIVRVASLPEGVNMRLVHTPTSIRRPSLFRDPLVRLTGEAS